MVPTKKVKRKSKTPARLNDFICEDDRDKKQEPRRSRRISKISEKLKRYMDDKGEMAPTKKVKRKSKTPARLNDFICEDDRDKKQEPRRSRRISKISEKLKRYMDDKGGVTKEQDVQVSNQTKKELQDTGSSDLKLLGSKYREPKVVLKALPKALLQKGNRKYPIYKREAQVTLKRLGNGMTIRKSNRIYTSKLHKQKAGLTKVVSTSSSKSSPVVQLKKVLKVELEDISLNTGRSQQNRSGKRKRVSACHEPQPQRKCSRMSPRMSEKKDKHDKTKEKGDLPLDPDVMKKVFNFGAKVEEVLSLNSEIIDKMSMNNDRAQSFSQMVSDRLEDIDENDIDKILNWLEEEECQRKEHREMMLESFRVSYSTNIALYSHMLTVLQSVTASV